jgi:hypothetical protein
MLQDLFLRSGITQTIVLYSKGVHNYQSSGNNLLSSLYLVFDLEKQTWGFCPHQL